MFQQFHSSVYAQEKYICMLMKKTGTRTYSTVYTILGPGFFCSILSVRIIHVVTCIQQRWFFIIAIDMNTVRVLNSFYG